MDRWSATIIMSEISDLWSEIPACDQIKCAFCRFVEKSAPRHSAASRCQRKMHISCRLTSELCLSWFSFSKKLFLMTRNDTVHVRPSKIVPSSSCLAFLVSCMPSLHHLAIPWIFNMKEAVRVSEWNQNLVSDCQRPWLNFQCFNFIAFPV